MTDLSTTPPADVIEYSMPSLGADMDEGSVVEWLVEVGDRVERGQVVARVETEKSDIDIEIWQEGVVAEIVVPTRRIVPVGTLLMLLHPVDQTVARTPSPSSPTTPLVSPPTTPSVTPPTTPSVTPPTTPSVTPPTTPSVTPPTTPSVTPPTTPSPTWRDPDRSDVVAASPLARRLAGERRISLTEVAGSGPRGAVRARDLPDAGARPPADAAPAVVSPDRISARADRMRSVIAQRMVRSNREIPHYRLERTVDLDALLRRLATINEDCPVADRIVPAAAFVQAVAHAAGRHRELNGTWTEDGFCPGSGVNVSVAISLRTGGLVTPTIPDADRLSLDETMKRIRDFTIAARSGVLRSEWMRDDSTITVTNLGDRGADLVHGLISPPEVALVGFGRILERPWVVDGTVVPRSVVNVTLGADHRATDGAIGSRYLSTLARFLEEPDQR